MKSAQLVTFLAIASLIVACGSQKSAVDDAVSPAEAQLEAGASASGEVSQSLSKTSQATATSTPEFAGFVSTQQSSFPKSAQTNVTQTAVADIDTAPKANRSSDLTAPKAGRDNPFALAEQPDFEVRFVTTNASKSLPPIPNVGFGPEPGASLLPGSPVAGPVALTPAVPTIVVPQGLSSIAVAPSSQSVVPPAATLSPVAVPVDRLPQATSPTALAEAVEIKGVVQLGDQIAVIINEGGGTLSRTVKPGARLAGGQVELRRIETNTAEPRVVLVQNGVEIVRGVGV